MDHQGDVYAGCMGQQPRWGTMLGVAPAEFLIIVFFWHPVMSFIVPLLLFEALSMSRDRDNPVIAGHAAILQRGRRSTALLALPALTGAAFLSFNAKFDLDTALVTHLGTVVIIAILWHCTTRWNGSRVPVFSLTLSWKGFAGLLVYLALLYGLTFILLLMERIAPPLTILLTLLFYAVIILLLRSDTPAERPAEQFPPDRESIGIPDLARALGLAVVLVALFCLLSPVGTAAAISLYIACTAGDRSWRFMSSSMLSGRSGHCKRDNIKKSPVFSVKCIRTRFFRKGGRMD